MQEQTPQDRIAGWFPTVDFKYGFGNATNLMNQGGSLSMVLNRHFLSRATEPKPNEYFEDEFVLTAILTHRMNQILDGSRPITNKHILNKHGDDILEVAKYFSAARRNKSKIRVKLVGNGINNNLVMSSEFGQDYYNVPRPWTNIIANFAFNHAYHHTEGAVSWESFEAGILHHKKKISTLCQLLAFMQVRYPEEPLRRYFGKFLQSRQIIDYALKTQYYMPSPEPVDVVYSSTLHRNLVGYLFEKEIEVPKDVKDMHRTKVTAAPTVVFSNILNTKRVRRAFSEEEIEAMRKEYRYTITTDIATMYLEDIPGSVEIIRY